jgi:hypothetical protein
VNGYLSLGKKYNLGGHTIKKVLIDSGLKLKKRKKCPKSDEKQKLRENKCLNKLVKNFLKSSNVLNVILDDESYFTVDGSFGGDGCYENGFYFQYEGLEVPENVKFKPIS